MAHARISVEHSALHARIDRNHHRSGPSTRRPTPERCGCLVSRRTRRFDILFQTMRGGALPLMQRPLALPRCGGLSSLCMIADPSAPSLSNTILSTMVSDGSVEPLEPVWTILSMGVAAAATAVGAACLVSVLAVGSWAMYEQYVLSLRKQRFKAGPQALKPKSVAASDPAFVPRRKVWLRSELSSFDGSQSPDGPILLAAKGQVFNVAKARNFYGPGGEYAIMGGADATRYLAKNQLQPETDAAAALPLNLAERAALAAWVFSLEQKYDCVGRLATDEEAAELAARSAYVGSNFPRL